MHRYSLANHVFVSHQETCVIWADLRRDEYIGVSRDELRGLEKVVLGWPAEDGEEVTEANVLQLAEQLVTAGLLIQGTEGRSAAPLVLPYPEEQFASAGEPVSPSIRELLELRLAIRAVRRRRRRSLESAINHLLEHNRGSLVPWTESEAARAKRLVGAFLRYRAFFYTSFRECLDDGLRLVEFLLRYQLSATLVIGVQLSPFAAHCWVQKDRAILNGHPSFAQQFTPIVAI